MACLPETWLRERCGCGRQLIRCTTISICVNIFSAMKQMLLYQEHRNGKIHIKLDPSKIWASLDNETCPMSLKGTYKVSRQNWNLS